MTIEELNPNNYQLTPILEENLSRLSWIISLLEKFSGFKAIVTSGLRTKEDQMRINPLAPNSRHMYGQAVDLKDTDGEWFYWLLDNPDIMIEYGVWMEDRRATPNWTHLQIAAPKSGKRIFQP